MSTDEDLGAADPLLRAALAASGGDRAAYHRTAYDAVRRARWLVPVTPMPGRAAEVATTLLAGPDGERTMPAFSGLDSLAAWRADARPVPVSAAVLADAAISEQCELLVLDLAGPARYVLTPLAIAALAADSDWQPPAQSTLLRAQLAALTRAHPELHAVTAQAGDRPDDVVLELQIRTQLPPERLRDLVREAVDVARSCVETASALRVVPVLTASDCR